MSDFKTSILVNRQVPEFVRDEHPIFVSFLEAYYEFLENKQGIKTNDLITKTKELRYVSDVDSSIDDFETNFFNTYAALIPKDTQVDKALLIKNLLPLYLAKGSEKSFKLLFRLLYGEEIEVVKPKNSILRASDGKWLVEKTFRISQDVYSTYTGDGTTKTFYFADTVGAGEFTVYINGSVVTNYEIRKETRKLIFNTAPANGALIRVLYNNFDYSLLTNRKLIGSSSGASAIVERVAQKTVSNVQTFELYINDKTLIGTFDDGEIATLDIIDSNDTLINIEVSGLAILKTINIIDGGANYNVGDPVLVTGGDATRDARADVLEVFSGFINKIIATAGGAGFKEGSNVYVTGAAANTVLTLAIDGIDISGANSANTFPVNIDKISDYGSVLISAADYGFPTAPTENASSRIIDALSIENVVDIGPITNVAILFSNSTFSVTPTLDADSAPFTASGASHHILSSRSIGRIQIYNGGTNYQVGDEIAFTPSGKPMDFGYGAAAAVKSVDANGTITKIEIQPQRVRGTANTYGNVNVTVTGTNTYFLDELRVGDRIIINNESRYINTISSNTSLTVNSNFNYATTMKYVGRYGDIIGGQNYEPNKLPTVAVSSTTGSGANIAVVAIMGDGEDLLATADKAFGEIIKIRIIDAGSGYQFAPDIDLTGYGDGTATANAEIETSYITFPGRWTTSDSILSSSERVLEGRNYYVDYSYVLSSSTEFRKFKQIFKNLIHPAGFIEYADYNINETILANNITQNTVVTGKTISGTVNVTSGSITVTGTNTKFNISNTQIINIGSQIAINSEIRTINSIQSNTVFTVSSAFSYTANAQDLIILS